VNPGGQEALTQLTLAILDIATVADAITTEQCKKAHVKVFGMPVGELCETTVTIPLKARLDDADYLRAAEQALNVVRSKTELGMRTLVQTPSLSPQVVTNLRMYIGVAHEEIKKAKEAVDCCGLQQKKEAIEKACVALKNFTDTYAELARVVPAENRAMLKELDEALSDVQRASSALNAAGGNIPSAVRGRVNLNTSGQGLLFVPPHR
jgi:hypothetical protein